MLVGATGVRAAARSNTHTLSHTIALISRASSVAAALKVCERLRPRGERGSQVKEGAMLVSVSGENYSSRTSSINTPTAAW